MLVFMFGLQGRLFTGVTLGLAIAGGAYASTVDEATFWYFHLSFVVLMSCNMMESKGILRT